MIDKAYRNVPIDITAGLTDHPIRIPGNGLIYNEGTADIEVKLNSVGNDTIKLSAKDNLIVNGMNIEKWFITAPATAETIKLIVSKPAIHIIR